VRAKTDCEVVPINEKSFLFLVDETPYFVMAVMRTLAARLRRGHLGATPLSPIFGLLIATSPGHDRQSLNR